MQAINFYYYDIVESYGIDLSDPYKIRISYKAHYETIIIIVLLRYLEEQ